MAGTSTYNPGTATGRDDASDRAMNTLSDAVDSTRDRVGDAAGRAREKIDQLSSAASETVDRWSSAAQDTMDTASDYAGQLSERGERLLDDARDYIGAHPLATIGMAAAAGFLIGRMMR